MNALASLTCSGSKFAAPKPVEGKHIAMLTKSTKQKIVARIASLRMKKDRLEARINAEMARPQPDSLVLHRLKRLRVRLKDDLTSLSGVMRTIARPSVPTLVTR